MSETDYTTSTHTTETFNDISETKSDKLFNFDNPLKFLHYTLDDLDYTITDDGFFGFIDNYFDNNILKTIKLIKERVPCDYKIMLLIFFILISLKKEKHLNIDINRYFKKNIYYILNIYENINFYNEFYMYFVERTPVNTNSSISSSSTTDSDIKSFTLDENMHDNPHDFNNCMKKENEKNVKKELLNNYLEESVKKVNNSNLKHSENIFSDNININKENILFYGNKNIPPDNKIAERERRDIRDRKVNKKDLDKYSNIIYIKKYIDLIPKNKIQEISKKTLNMEFNCYKNLINIGEHIINNNIKAKDLHNELYNNYIYENNINSFFIDKNMGRFRRKCIRLYKLTKYVDIYCLLQLKIFKKITDMKDEIFDHLEYTFKNIKIQYI